MGTGTLRRGTRGAALLALALLLPAAAARGDAEETEIRLKEAGVDPAFRARVHAAIDRAVAYFAGIQREDGTFETPSRVRWFRSTWVPGVTGLAGLACRHAGTPRGREVAARAISWLVPEPGKARRRVEQDVYTAGIVTMLLQASRTEPAVIRRLADVLARSQSPVNGWWGYPTPETPPGMFGSWDPGEFPRVATQQANLSTTQFAVLGLRAAGRAREDVPAEVWDRHLRAMMGTQDGKGTWAYTPARPGPGVLPEGRNPYPQGTFMGLAGLVLAEAAVRAAPEPDPRLLEEARAALARAREALVRDGRDYLREFRRGVPDDNEGFSLYTLYALEKACVFAGVERLGDVPWYRAGAEVLLDTQNGDGGWGSKREPGKESRWEPSSAPLTSAFALLYLVRSSEVYRTKTPRLPDRETREVASGGGDTPSSPPADPAGAGPPAPAAAPPAPLVVPVEDAVDALARLDTGLKDPESTEEALGRSLDWVDRALVGFAAGAPGEDPSAVEAWRRRAEVVLLRALVPGGRGNDRVRSRVRAAEVLGRCDPRVSPVLQRALEAGPLREREPDRAVLAAALRAVAALGGEDAFAWVLEETVRPDDTPAARVRAAAGLGAIPLFEGIPGTVRRDACRRTALLFAPRESAAASAMETGVPPAAAAVDYWREMEDPVMDALRALARDPATGAAPSLPSGAWAGTVGRMLEWLDDHEDPRRPPWR